MDWITLSVGSFALVYGLYTIFARLKTPEKFGKLDAMKQQYGARVGTLVHTLSYTLIPIIFGVMMIWGGIKGVSLFGSPTEAPNTTAPRSN